MRPALVAVLVVLLVPMLPLVAAQDAGLDVNGPEGPARVRPGGSVTIAWDVTATSANQTVVAALDHDGRRDWNVTVSPQRYSLAAGDTGRFTVTVAADQRPLPRTITVTLRLLVLDPESEKVDESHHMATVEAVGTRLVLGIWENPLGPPLDGAWGAFLANAVAWTVIAMLAMYAIDPTLRLLTRRSVTELDDHIIRIMRFPVFIVLATYGLRQSLEVFDLSDRLFDLLGRLWTVVLMVAGFYAAYRVWQEVIIHVGKRMAMKTESRLDDRLIPVLEKIGGIIILIIGFFFIVDNLGFDMTVFAAGGVLGGMVIAFAAQDTLSNFFSGVQILTDQPFVEGDDILLDTGEVCTVQKIGLRTTELYHLAHHEVILIPNNHLAQNRIINLLRPDKRYKIRIDVGVAYGSDIQLVKDTLMEVARSHPLTLKDAEHEPFVRFRAFGASSLDFAVHAWVEDVYARWAVASEMREMIDKRFAERAIEIPFPQQVNWDGATEAERLAKRRQGLGGTAAPRPTRSTHEARRQVGVGDEVGSSGGEGEPA